MGISLADIAGLDVSEVNEIRMGALPKGNYVFEVKKADLEEGTNKDNEQRFIITTESEVVEVISLIDPKEDKEALIGRKYTDKQYIVPEKWEEGVGLYRGRVTDMGCDSSGVLGEVVERTVGHQYRAKITHRRDRDDREKFYADMQIDAKANIQG